jgi:hypothetical protein
MESKARLPQRQESWLTAYNCHLVTKAMNSRPVGIFRKTIPNVSLYRIFLLTDGQGSISVYDKMTYKKYIKCHFDINLKLE